MKILVVDDEQPIRQWFIFLLEKARHSHQIFEASNGNEALEIFKQHLPELVFTDIKMPVMDGIELMKTIKAVAPATDIVLLTCYTDFAFAKEAIKQGAAGYLIKAEIQTQEVNELLERIAQRRKAQGLAEKALEIQAEVNKNLLLNDLMQGELGTAELILARLRENRIFLTPRFLFSLAFRPRPNEPFEHSYQTLLRFACPVAENLAWFKLEPEQLLILLGNLHGNPSQAGQTSDLQELCRAIQHCVAGSMGVSKVYFGLENLPLACREARELVKMEFFQGEGCIVLPESAHTRQSGLGEIEAAQKRLFREIEAKNGAAVLEAVQAVLDLIELKKFRDPEWLFRFCTQVLELFYVKTCLEISVPNHFFSENEKEVRSQQSFGELKEWMLNKVHTLVASFNQSQDSYSPAVFQAVQYIESRFAEPLSLVEVANHVHLNPNYFCQRFKTETGENFSDFLVMMRLKTAEKLLKTTHLKLYEIAEQVGYPNLSYFSRLFKKHLGKGPLEYRKS